MYLLSSVCIVFHQQYCLLLNSSACSSKFDFTSSHNNCNFCDTHSCQAYFQRLQNFKHSHWRQCSENVFSRCEVFVSKELKGRDQSTCCIRISLTLKENKYENNDMLISPAKKVIPAPMSIELKLNANNSRSTIVKMIHHVMISVNTSADLVSQRSFCSIHFDSCSRDCLSHFKTLLPWSETQNQICRNSEQSWTNLSISASMLLISVKLKPS